MNKNLRAFWDEICLPENQDIRKKLFRLGYTWIEKDTDGDDRFEEIQEELNEVIENDENFTKTRQGWKFNYIVRNTDWLFVKRGETYGILFDNAMVNRDTEFDAYYRGVDLYNYPFWEDEFCNSWEDLVKENLNWCPDFEKILNKYLQICNKHGFTPCLGNKDGPSTSLEEFDALVYKDFKDE